MPALNYMILPNDHTNGTTTGDYTPQAMIADNDLALGQIVDAISHSKIWSSTAIFVVEDDSQDGADHVDSHRSPALRDQPLGAAGRRGRDALRPVLGAAHDRADPGARPAGAQRRAGHADVRRVHQRLAEAQRRSLQRDRPRSTRSTRRTPNRPPTPSCQTSCRGISSTPSPRRSPIRSCGRRCTAPKSRRPPPGPNASPDEIERAVMMRYLSGAPTTSPASAAARAWAARWGELPDHLGVQAHAARRSASG